MLAAAVAVVANAVPAAAGQLIRPCRPGTPAYEDARAKLDAIDAEIRKLTPAADPEPAAKKLAALSDETCFRIVGHLDVEAKSGLALRTWWEDGGHSVAGGALELGGNAPIVWVAPDVRRALTRETARGHRLLPLLCPAYDDSCGRDTDGWRLRAEAALGLVARARYLEGRGSGPSLSDWKRERRPTDQDCAAYAQHAPRLRQLARFRACLSATAERGPAFRIGRVQKPTQGWFVVSGRRGHYQFCDELRAFDLATGASYRVASCSGLALVSDGSVDHRATDAARKAIGERGTVSLDEIREAVWMLLQVGELDEAVLQGAVGQAPLRWIPLETDGVDEESFSFAGFGAGSSGNTLLSWRVVTPAGTLGDGTLTWPRDLTEADAAYAAELLEIAEASFKPGCPPARPPVTLARDLTGLSAHPLDSDAASLGKAESSLSRGWRALVTESCSGR